MTTKSNRSNHSDVSTSSNSSKGSARRRRIASAIQCAKQAADARVLAIVPVDRSCEIIVEDLDGEEIASKKSVTKCVASISGPQSHPFGMGKSQ